jgi:hypothetical protein
VCDGISCCLLVNTTRSRRCKRGVQVGSVEDASAGGKRYKIGSERNGWEDVDCVLRPEGRNKCWAVVNTVMNLRCVTECGKRLDKLRNC